MVRIPRLDKEVPVDAIQSMLDALEGAGVEVMWDCRKGECGLCTVKVLDVTGHLDGRHHTGHRCDCRAAEHVV